MDPAQGAWVPGPGRRMRTTPSLAAARAAVQRLVESGVARGEAARRVSAETGVPRRQLYAPGDAPGAPGDAPGAAAGAAPGAGAGATPDTDGNPEASSTP